jgi:hypothetical protein
MKLRIKGNSLRYRLTKSDIAQLQMDGFVKETVEFLNTMLTYVLQVASTQYLSADYNQNVVTVYMPRKMMAKLAETEEVGFEGDSGKLHILVEKDFVCIDNVVEDQSDNYPNPMVLNGYANC